MLVTAESAEQGTAAKQRRSDVNIEAIKELVDINITLVEKRIVACETQYKIAIPLPYYPPQAKPQNGSQAGQQASLSTISSMARSAASAARGFRLVRAALHRLLGLAAATFLCAKRSVPAFEQLIEGCMGASLCIWDNFTSLPSDGSLHRGRELSDSCQLGRYQGRRCLPHRPPFPATLCGALSSRWLGGVSTAGSAQNLARVACPGLRSKGGDATRDM